MNKTKFSCCIIGSTRLIIVCADLLIKFGHKIYAIITIDQNIIAWCCKHDIIVFSELEQLKNFNKPIDYLFSILNLSILQSEILSIPKKYAINYHDGPLPKYAGRNAASWSIINQERQHGITWHLMSEKVDAGNVLAQKIFEISNEETALSLNLKCFEAASNTFESLIKALALNSAFVQTQDISKRTFYTSYKPIPDHGFIRWDLPIEKIDSLIRALDHGNYPNRLTAAKILVDNSVFLIKMHKIAPEIDSLVPGEITRIENNFIQISARTGVLRIYEIADVDNRPCNISKFVQKLSLKEGKILYSPSREYLDKVDKISHYLTKYEKYWLKVFSNDTDFVLPLLNQQKENDQEKYYSSKKIKFPAEFYRTFLGQDKNSLNEIHIQVAIIIIYLCKIKNSTKLCFSYTDDRLKDHMNTINNYISQVVPFNISLEQNNQFLDIITLVKEQLDDIKSHTSFTRDIFSRYPILATIKDACLHNRSLLQVRVVKDFKSNTDISPRAFFNFVVIEDGNGFYFSGEDKTVISTVIRDIQALITNLLAKPYTLLKNISLLNDLEYQ